MTTKRQKKESRARLIAKRAKRDREIARGFESRKKYPKAFAGVLLFALAILSGILILGLV